MIRFRSQQFLWPSSAIASITLICGWSCLISPASGSQQPETNGAAQSSGTATITGAAVFPDSTVAYLQINRGDELVSSILQHPLRDRIEQLEEYQTAIASPAMVGAAFFLSNLESQLGQRWDEAVKNITKNVYVGFDADTNGLVVLLEAEDESKLRRAATSLISWSRDQARQKGDPIPEIKQYGDTKFASLNGDVVIARWQNWFVVSNKKMLGKTVVDNINATNEATAQKPAALTLQNAKWFQQATQKVDSQAWAVFDLAKFRDGGVAKELFAGKTDNPGAELILGGIFDGLHDADFALLELTLDDSISISAAIPFQRSQASDAREFFYGQDFSGRAPAPLIPENMIANLISHRDIGAWWLSKEDLYAENVIAGLAQADSQLSTLFAGLDFGQDVLGAVQPGVQIVVTEQVLPDSYDPDLKLPAFAFISKLREPEKVQRRFKVAYQSLIGFLNINLGMQGQPQLDVETVRTGKRVVSSAEYWLEEDSDKGLVIYNFSPSIAFEGEYFIVASTKALANELAELAADHQGGTIETNTRLDILATPLVNALALNRDALVANNMISDGNTKEAAEMQIGILLRALDLLKEGKLDLQVKPDFIELDFNLSFDAATK